MQKGKELFVTLVTEVSLISRESNLRFERESLYLGDFSENRLFSSFSLLHSTLFHEANFPVTESRDTERFSEKSLNFEFLPSTKITASQECHDGIVELLEKEGVRILSFYDRCLIRPSLREAREAQILSF